MLVGHSQNRFYVGNVFARLVGALRDPNEILMAADVLGEDRTAARWYAEYFSSRASVPDEIREILEGVA